MGLPTTSLDLTIQRSRKHQRRRIKIPLWIISAIGIILYVQFSILPRYFSTQSPAAITITTLQLEQLEAGLAKCVELNEPVIHYSFPISSSRENSRWNSKSGQNDSVIIRNATLFEGEKFIDHPVDIIFKKGVITSISPVSTAAEITEMTVVDAGGKYVTPGLVDMHSHHLSGVWPRYDGTEDDNEVDAKVFGPLTPFVRVLDSIHPYDFATTIIASGGVTSSLILPGSANIMGGEGFPVKNILKSGPNGEEVVEELLLEYGVPLKERRRYMKMACGENPSRVYQHTRMGNAFLLREHMASAEDLRQKQDMWCKSATAVRATGDSDAEAIARLTADGGLPESLKLDSSVAMLRGKIGVNVHCYETEDFWDMLQHSKEFGFRVQAFHHALDAWKVPEMIKEKGENITIATFSDFGLYKKEAYGASLYAGKILAEHGVPVAYKSDHTQEFLNAKYILFQAANSHSFGLPADLALQSVTSVPAKSLELNHRIGYARPGYDADLVIWDSHPLSLGATALQVYIDGKATLDPIKVVESLSKVRQEVYTKSTQPKTRKELPEDVKEEICKQVEKEGNKVVITGIKQSYLQTPNINLESIHNENLTMVLQAGKISRFGPHETCISSNDDGTSTILHLENGHILPGLTAVSVNLGLIEIAFDASTGDGSVSQKGGGKALEDAENIVYAKYGIHLEGKAFKRAQIGGITKAITMPLVSLEDGGGALSGISVGIKTSEKRSILDGGVFREDVALHLSIGQVSKGTEGMSTISSAVANLRKLLTDSAGKDNVFGRVTNGSLPLVIGVENKYDIMQLIKIKQDYPKVNLVLMGGAGLPYVAKELATAHIPVILTTTRGAPDTFEKIKALSGPPLTRSPASILTDAGVKFALAISGFSDSFIHNLPLEAGWAAKYSGLDKHAAVNLVSRNVEEILGLDVREETRDFVIFEGDPLEFGASVVLAVDGVDNEVVSCWPVAE